MDYLQTGRKTLFAMGTLTSVLFLSACGSDKNQPEKPISAYAGTWQLQGYGETLQIKGESLVTFNNNSYGCVQVSDVSLDTIPLYTKYLKVKDDKLIFNSPYSSNETYKKLAELPENCAEDKLLKTNDPIVNFEFLWHTFNDYYAFFELRELDWQAVYEAYRPMVNENTTKVELDEIFESILDDIDDGHVGLVDGDNHIANGGDIDGLPLQAYKLALVNSEVENIGEYYFAIQGFNEELVKLNLVDNQLNSYQESNAIKWGKLAGNIGYLNINRVMGMNHTDDTLPDGINDQFEYIKQDLLDTDTIMQAVLADLKGTQGLVIDLRKNDGGIDKVSQKIASYFSQTAREFGNKQVFNNRHQGEVISLEVAASPIEPYIKPIYVLTGQSAGSGGEVLTLALKSLPHVTVIGQPTAGYLSDSLDLRMPNGYELSLSNEVYQDLEGNKLEGTGVKPDIEIPIYASIDYHMQSDTPIDYVMQQFNVTPVDVPAITQVEQQIANEFEGLNIPGMAVAVIKNDQIIWEKGFGIANLETENPVTEHTPFNIGSISKAVMATAISQQIELGNINLDMPINSMGLPFEVKNPHSNEPIRLKHLVSHSSGILDTAGYNCSYYIHDTGESLYYAFGVDSCNEQVTTDPASFFQEYFTAGGLYNNDDVFATDEEAQPGANFEYSNVAAGLAGFAIEKHLGADFTQIMKTQLFDPLEMNNTAWHHTELNENNPKATQYTLDEDDIAIEIPEYSYPTFFDGDLNASAHDLSRLLIAVANEGEIDGKQILKPETVAMMLSQPLELFTAGIDEQGIFWRRNGGFIGHTGGDPGTYAVMQYNMVTRSGYVVLMNGEDSHLGKDEIDDKLAPLLKLLYRAGLNN